MRFLSERFLQEYPQANLVLLILDLSAQSNPFKPDDVRTEGARHQERQLVDWDDPRIVVIGRAQERREPCHSSGCVTVRTGTGDWVVLGRRRGGMCVQ